MAQLGKDVILVRQAQAVLEFNWIREYTRPGARLYPRQWSGDSALIAIAYPRYDQERARRELTPEERSEVARKAAKVRWAKRAAGIVLACRCKERSTW